MGSVVPFGTPIALVVDERERSLVDDLVAACYRIGYRVEAVLDPGIDVWQEAGYQLESYPATDILEVVTELACRRDTAITRRPRSRRVGQRDVARFDNDYAASSRTSGARVARASRTSRD